LKKIATGSYPPELFTSSLEMIKNQLISIADEMENMLSFRRNQLTAGRNIDIDGALALVRQITPEQINELAAKLTRQVTYVLVPEAEADTLYKGQSINSAPDKKATL